MENSNNVSDSNSAGHYHRRAFIVKKSLLRNEEDLISDAAVYFYPLAEELNKAYVAVRCRQLVGVSDVLKDIGMGIPNVFKFTRGLTAVRSWGDLYVYLEGKPDETASEVELILDKVCHCHVHLCCSFERLWNTSVDFRSDLKLIWDRILKYYLDTLGPYDRMFSQQNYGNIKQKDRNVLLMHCKLLIDRFTSTHEIIGGCVFYHNKILYTDTKLEQINPVLLDSLAIIASKGNQQESRLPLVEIELGDLMANCNLYVIYLYKEDWRSLGGQTFKPVTPNIINDLSIRMQTSMCTDEKDQINSNKTKRESSGTIIDMPEGLEEKLGVKSPLNLDLSESSLFTHSNSSIISTDVYSPQRDSAILQDAMRKMDTLSKSLKNINVIQSITEDISDDNSDTQPRSKLPYMEDQCTGSPIDDLVYCSDDPIHDAKYSTLKKATLEVRASYFAASEHNTVEVEDEALITEVCLISVSVNNLKLFLLAEREIDKSIQLLLNLREESVLALGKLISYVNSVVLSTRTSPQSNMLAYVTHDTFDNNLLVSRDSTSSEITFQMNIRILKQEMSENPDIKGVCLTRRKMGVVAKKKHTRTCYYQATRHLNQVMADKQITPVDALMFLEREGKSMLPKHHRLSRILS